MNKELRNEIEKTFKITKWLEDYEIVTEKHGFYRFAKVVKFSINVERDPEDWLGLFCVFGIFTLQIFEDNISFDDTYEVVIDRLNIKEEYKKDFEELIYEACEKYMKEHKKEREKEKKKKEEEEKKEFKKKIKELVENMLKKNGVQENE